MYRLLLNLIPKSVRNAASQVSSTRIQSYAVLLLIFLYSTFVFMSEIVMMFTSENYVGLTAEFLIAFAGILTHHLALLGINKNSKAEPKMEEIPHTKEEKEEKPDLEEGMNS